MYRPNCYKIENVLPVERQAIWFDRGVLALLWIAFIGVLAIWLLWITPRINQDVTDFTDSGVGCLDDCLEIQDEAQTTLSQGRN